jgi:uncharacterized delta-60 repeat protein
MKLRGWLLPSLPSVITAASIIACGDDDASPPRSTIDSGTSTIDSGTPSTTDSGNDSQPLLDVSVDALPSASPPIIPTATTRIANSINPYGLLFATDGFLYAAGATIDATAADRKLAVWRFKDGALDTTFGNSGSLTVGIDGSESSFDIVEVSPGNFVVHAVTSGTSGKVYLVKLTKDAQGAFSFGTPVMVAFDWSDGDFTGWPGATPPAYASSWGIALDKSVAATPKIVVFANGAPAKGKLGATSGTQRTDSDRWIARVLADTLAPDPTFNGGKAFSIDGDGKELNDNARRGIVLADGSIVSAGYTNFGVPREHIVLIRLKPDGTVDPTFGFGTTAPGVPGMVKVNPFTASNGSAEAYDVVRQSSGRYVTAGYGVSNFNGPSIAVDVIATGVKPNGDELDPKFGKAGAFAWQSEMDKSAGLGAAPFVDRSRVIAVLPDDRLVLGGVYDDFASLFVLDKDGKPDPSSGTAGLIEYNYPAPFHKIAVSADGKQIAATVQSLNQTADAGAPLGSVLMTLKVGP